MWLLTVARVRIYGKNKDDKDCFDLAENKNKKFEKKVKEVLQFTLVLREKEKMFSLFLIHLISSLKQIPKIYI